MNVVPQFDFRSPKVSDSHKKKCASYLEKGYRLLNSVGKPDKKPFLPLEDKLASFKLFDIDINKETDLMEFHYDGKANEHEVTEETMKDFASKVEFKAGYSNKQEVLVASASQSISSKFGFAYKSKSKEIFYTRIEDYSFGYIDFDTGSAMRLLTDGARKDLNSCDSAEGAKSIIERYGIGYIKMIHLGCTFDMWSKTKRSHTLTKAAVEVGASKSMGLAKGRMSTEQKIGGSLNFNVESGRGSISSTMNFSYSGGDVNLIEDKDKWRASAAENPTAVRYDIEPIFTLVDHKNPAYDILKDAYKKEYEKYKDNIPDFEDGDYDVEDYTIKVHEYEDSGAFTHHAVIELYWGKLSYDYLDSKHLIEKVRMEREAYFKWRTWVKAPGANLGKKIFDNVNVQNFRSTRPLDSIESMPEGVITKA